MLDCRTMNSSKEALKRAIANSGGQAAFARAIGVTSQAVSQWKKVPPLRVLAAENISGVPRGELRPDLYPSDEARA